MTLPAHLGAYWYVACLSRQLGRRPLARTILGRHLVLFRDTDGRAAVLLDRCPHRNAPLSGGRVRRDHLACPYHGWEFDRSGRCQAIPGREGDPSHPVRCVPAFPVVEEAPLVWVCPTPGAPPAGPPRVHLVEPTGYATLARTFSLDAPLLDALENFLDGTHTHFVHAGLVRTSRRKTVEVAVRRRPDQVEAEYREERQSGLISKLFGRGVTHSFGRFLLPATVQLDYHAGPRVVSRFTLYFTPRDEGRQEVFAVLAARAPGWLAPVLSVPLGLLLWRVVRQDQRILALQKANVERFGGPDYTSTELDLLRPAVAALLKAGPQPDEAAAEKRLTLFL